MVHVGYCGENLEEFKVREDSGLGFPGIFFYYGYSDAKKLAEANGGKVYIAECELGKIKENRSGLKLFDSLSDVMVFINNYLPDWVGSDGLLLDSRRKEVNSMLGTYPGHYDLVKVAANHNNMEVAELLDEIGVNSIVMPYGFAITSPSQILSYQEVDHQLTNEEIEVESLPAEESIAEAGTYAAFETKSNDYIRKAKHGKPYKTKPGNRFIRRVKIRTNGGNSTWFDIDINRLFKKSSFAVKIPVIGETSEYTCIISFEDWLPKLKADILANGFTQLVVKKSLAEMMRFNDLKVRCSCPDFRYRHAYWLTVNGDIEGDPELRPSDETNPKDDLGGICKHLSLCFTGDTKIRTLDGKTQTLVELKSRFESGDDLWVYSVDKNGDFIPGKVTDVFLTGVSNLLTKVTLDNGVELKCTPDHLFMSRDGNWVKAKDLASGDSLMPLYFKKNKKGYELVKLNSTGVYSPTYFRVANYCNPEGVVKAREKSLTEVRKGVAIHHKDFNKENNLPSNLEPMTILGHILWHSENGSFTRLWKDPEFKKKYSKVSSEFMTNLQKNPTQRLLESRRQNSFKRKGSHLTDETKRKIGLASKGRKVVGHPMSEEAKKLISLRISEWWRTHEMTQKMVEARSQPHSSATLNKIGKASRERWASSGYEEIRSLTRKVVKNNPNAHRNQIRKIKYVFTQLLNSGLSITEENYEIIRRSLPTGKRGLWASKFKTFSEATQSLGINHKVVSVETINVDSELVYDLTVEGCHNFLVEDSVIVHNCLNNKWTYFDKVSRIIYNYFINLERTQKALFDRVVAPKLGLDELRKRGEEAASKAAENDSVDQVEKELEDGIKQDQAIQPEPQVKEQPEEVAEEEPETTEEPAEPVEEEGEPEEDVE